MKCIKPQYYERFQCIASACPDSCCKEWNVDVDPEAAARYRALPGPLGDRLRAVLQDTPDGTIMTIENSRCPMWQQDGLCRIQAELGHDALCHVCRQFPRLRHEYGDFTELDLELSCPEAARLILADDGKILEENLLETCEADYDREAMAVLLRSRQQILDFLCAPHCSVPQTLTVLLLYAHEVQAELDGMEQADFVPEQYLTRAAGFPKAAADIDSILAFFRDLEILTPHWRARLETSAESGRWTSEHLALARYFIRRYWLQAVSDLDLVCRAKMTIIACLLVNALGGDPVQTAQQFSKEIENNPDNVEAILDAAYTCPAFTDLALLGLLLK